ncbi:MAG: c-5 sterol desaturase [Cirrosporium novae-zelandiae]|nr:MAG: c-5 sterol desaturase [Cirrosporium novae-zelandiae]
MDVVVEVFDAFLGDRFYAALLPAASATDIFSNLNTGSTNTTLSGIHESPTAYHPSYVYKPATEYELLQFPPGDLGYSSIWARDNIYRQATSLFLIIWLFGLVIYYTFASFSYIFIFDKATFKHPKYLNHQIRQEIVVTMKAMPIMSVLTVPFMLAEIRGYSKLYDSPKDAPFSAYNFLQFPLFIMFTDFCIYWIHRWLHHRLIYKYLHKPHHKWIMPSPYASHAFHPVDGWSQAFPYHAFPFIFPLQKFAYIALFAFINIWTVMIHDGEYVATSPVINGAACHTMHHLYFNYNYGQFTTLWDRIGGSYRQPNIELFKKETKMGRQEWQRQVNEMETILKEVEGSDDREYLNEKGEAAKKTQ